MDRSVVEERISLLVDNRNFLSTEEHVSTLITKASSFSKSLANLEDSLLRLSNGHAEGLFYLMILRFQPQGNHDSEIYQLRYFETGSFEGCFAKNKDVLFDKNSSTGNSIEIPWKVYTSQDVEILESSKSKTKDTKKRMRSDMNFRNLIYQNKSSVSVSLQNLEKEVLNATGVECLGYVVYVLRYGHKISPLKKRNSETIDCFYQSLVPSTTEKTRSILEDFASSASPAIHSLKSTNVLQTFFQILSEVSNYPFLEKDEEKESKKPHMISPRQKLIQVLKTGNIEESYDCLRDLLLHSTTSIKKKREGKQRLDEELEKPSTSKTKSVMPKATLLENVNAKVTLPLFSRFKMKVRASCGFILRQNEKEGVEITVINNYDPFTGEFKPKDFVHIKRIFNSKTDSAPIIKCSCKAFSSSEGPDTMKCMHCRLVQEWNNDTDANVPLSSDFSPVYLVSHTKNIDKYSVVEHNNGYFVHVTREAMATKIECQSGFCKWKKDKYKQQCTHGCAVENVITSENSEENEEFKEYEVDETGVFCADTGQWKFPSLSCHSVCDSETDPILEQKIRERDNMNDSTLQRDSEGYLAGTNIIPEIPTEVCPCGAGWICSSQEKGLTVFEDSTILYTELGAIKCDVFKRVCMSNRCFKMWREEEDRVFRLTSKTCAGYEIGWKFVSYALNCSKPTFNGFCKIYDETYKLRGDVRGFMSPPTFVKWFLAWASNLRGRFCEQTLCCGSSPQALAGDGTKIGISMEKVFVNPIERPHEANQILQTTMRRYDRTFFKYERFQDGKTNGKEVRILREYIQMAADVIAKDGNVELNDNLLELIDVNFPFPCQALIMRFLRRRMQRQEEMSCALVLNMLCQDASLSSFIPISALDMCSRYLSDVNENSTDDFIKYMEEFTPELSQLLLSSAFSSNNNLPHEDVLALLTYIVERVEEIRNTSVKPETPRPIPHSYNPPKNGRAYYFETEGRQIRYARKFSIDKENDKKYSVDDEPSSGSCSKNYGVVHTTKGTTQLFLWFCPKHGDCYGFHIIPGAEGRKDPAASLYTHLENPPTHLFYDFACGLEEYGLNRESGYFLQSRMFHDVFHGYKHKCSSVFRYNRLEVLEKVNSEICEQFNSFLQSIKASSKKMKQQTFCFYVEFFIWLWNKKKLLRRQKLSFISDLANQ